MPTPIITLRKTKVVFIFKKEGNFTARQIPSKE